MAETSRIPLKFLPSMFPDDSETAAEGAIVSGQWVRTQRKQWQTMGGFESVILSNFSGVCRGLHAWSLSNGVVCIAIGTHTHLYVYYGGTYYDITPVDASGTLGADPITTTNGSAVVSIADTSHGRLAGDRVILSGATAVGGITISGEYTVTTRTDANNYTITHSSAATSGATGGGGSVEYTYLLPVGRQNGTGVGGYGTGTYGTGTYGSFTAQDYRPRVWTFGNFGPDLIACPMDGTIYRWQGSTGTRAAVLTNAPGQVNTVFVDPNGLVVAVGSDPEGSTTFKPLLVRHSDQEAITDWTASAADQAGEYPFYIGSRLVRGLPGGNGFNALWTDTHMIVQRYTGEATLVYSYSVAGPGGLEAPNAVGVLGGVFYWRAPDGQFYRSAGGPPEPIPCPGQRTINENIAPAQLDKTFCMVNAAFNEVGWVYTDSRDGSECSRYAIFNTVDGGWTFGEIDRTAWIDRGPLQSPAATSSAGRLYYHDRGQSADGAALESSLKAAPIDLGEGDTLYEIQRLIRDVKDQVGPIDYYFHTRNEPNETAVENGPYTATAATKTLEPLLSARQVAWEIRANSAPSFWRLGVERVEALDTGESY